MSELAVTAAGLSAGALLRQAREAAGLHIGALSLSLKVPVKKIEALEADRLDQLPDAVFARALASSICRTLKVDPTAILAALPQGQRTMLKADDDQMNASFQPTGGAPLNSMRDLVSKPFVIIGLALVAGALILLALPERTLPSASISSAVDTGTTSTNVPVGSISSIASIASVAEVGATSVPQKDLTPNPQARPDLALTSPNAASGVTNLAASAEKPTSPMPSAAPSLVAPQSRPDVGPIAVNSNPAGVIAFEARGPSWVEVTDSAGVVQLRKTLAAGETIAATGQAPLKVIVGRADAISVKVRGQDFALSAVSRDNVARFEVK